MSNYMLAFGLGWGEIVVIMLVILLLFGAKKLPELAKGMGKGIREFRTAMRDVQEEIDINPPEPTAPQAQAPTQTVSQSDNKEQSAS